MWERLGEKNWSFAEGRRTLLEERRQRAREWRRKRKRREKSENNGNGDLQRFSAGGLKRKRGRRVGEKLGAWRTDKERKQPCRPSSRRDLSLLAAKRWC